jgi:hypothetical protein
VPPVNNSLCPVGLAGVVDQSLLTQLAERGEPLKDEQSKTVGNHLTLTEAVDTNHSTSPVSALSGSITLAPEYVTGLTDAEWNFSINVQNSSGKGGGKKCVFAFKVSQHEQSSDVLYALRDYFGCGTVVVESKEDGMMKYHVQKQSDLLERIIPHFTKFPLVTSKRLNFEDFARALNIYANRQSLSLGADASLESVLAIKASMNKARPFEEKSKSVSLTNLSPEWVRGFADVRGHSMFM